jgi:hypothetical protein
MGYAQIRHNGFEESSVFSADAKLALQASMDKVDYETKTKYRCLNLSPIPEDATILECREKDFLGWIAVIATGSGTVCVGKMNDRSETVSVTTLKKNCQSLPLVSFDASLRTHASIQRLLKGTCYQIMFIPV